MTYLAWLEKALSAAAAREKVGTLVAARLILELTQDHGVLTLAAANALDITGRWFGAPLAWLYAQGGVRQGYVSVLAEFTGGQTAVIVCETQRGERGLAAALVFGNHGTVQFEDAPEAAPLNLAASALTATVEQSLTSGKTVRLSHAG